MDAKTRDRRRDLAWASLLALSFLTLYASFLTKAYVFEGLARAMPIETGRFRSLFNGNYLLYGFAGWCFHGLLKAFGADLLAVVSLQLFDCLCGAAGVFLFFRVLRRLGAERPAAAAWTGVLGLCLGYWSWSVDAQNYIFSTLLLTVNLYFLVELLSGRRLAPWTLGLLHALAVTGHIVNGLFGFAVVYALVRVHGRAWRRPVLEYAAAAAGGILACYGLALAVVRPPDALRWFMGSLAAGDGSARWHGKLGFGLAAFGAWLQMSLNIFTSRAPEFSAPPPWPHAALFLWAARGLLAALALRLALSARRLAGPARSAAGLCGVWLLAYALVFTSWEPHTMVYRVSDLVPAVLLLYLGGRGSRDWAWPAALAACLGLGNLGAEIRPRSFASNNPHLVRMAFVKEATTEGSWVLTLGGGAEELYLPFFAERNPIQLGAYDQAGLGRRLDGLLEGGQAVYATSRVFEDEAWRAFLARYRPEAAAEGPDGFTLFKLSGLTAR